MAHPLTYSDGSPVRDGDKVLTEGGTLAATVLEVALKAGRTKDLGAQGRGVVLDVHPRGLVFLSEAYLQEDPLQFVARGPDASVRFGASAALGAAAVVFIPVLISLFSGIFYAFSTGEVMVISLGRTEVRMESVPWAAGWARFAGPVLLLSSLCVYVGARSWSWRWWAAAAGCALALVLVSFSLWFTSLRGTAWFVALSVFVGAAFYAAKKYRQQREE
ncbi:hypothetical protein [Polaromonas sp.]|uniref:hypothetical protein n=1 Tax=Polaromonas sp. TaxID=1869339 RepID=UPI0032672C5B